ncbi:ankyrin repeat-containing domain protein [Aspergillus heterothallicus]
MSKASRAIATAADEGNTPLVLSLLSEHRSSKPVHQSFLDLALHHAAEHGHVQLIAAVLKRGGRAACPCHGPVIRRAAKYGTLETVELLLRQHRSLPCWPWAYKTGKWMTSFLDAAAAGKLSTVRLMLDEGFSPDFRYQCPDCRAKRYIRCGACRPESALQLAAQYGHGQVVELLLSRGAVAKTEKEGEFTALHRAASGGYLAIVGSLLKAGWEPNAADESSKTPLYEAAVHHHDETFRVLRYGGGRVGNNEAKHLDAMVVSKNTKAVEMLLPHLPKHIFYRYLGDKHPNGDILQRATRTGDTDLIKLIINYATEHFLLEDLKFRAAFIDAASHGTLPAIDLLFPHCRWSDNWRKHYIHDLIEKQAALGHTDAVLMLIEWHYEFGRDASLLGTGMYAAIAHRRAGTVQALIRTAGAEVHTVIRRRRWHHGGPTTDVPEVPLHLAVRGGSADVCKILLDHGADLRIMDSIGRTMLHIAAGQGDAEIVSLLLDHGADATATFGRNWTAMHCAAMATCGGEKVLKCLVDKAGVDINARNDEGQTPLHIAALNWEGRPLSFLKSIGADNCMRDDRGRTPECILI